MSDPIKPVFAGEAMLLRWNQNHKGRTVTLQLDPHEGAMHPFEGLPCGENGQRMKLCAVLIGDDEQPVPPPTSAQPTQATKVAAVRSDVREEKPKDKKQLTRSQMAALKLQDDDFCAFLDKLAGVPVGGIDDYDMFLKFHLGIVSKRELDSDQAAGDRWDALETSFRFRDQVRE